MPKRAKKPTATTTLIRRAPGLPATLPLPWHRPPATEVEVEMVIETILAFIDVVADELTAELGQQRREDILKNLKTGAVARMKVIAAAEAGDRDAYLVLCDLGRECMSYWKDREPPAELIAFFQRSLGRPPPPSSKGWSFADQGKEILQLQIW